MFKYLFLLVISFQLFAGSAVETPSWFILFGSDGCDECQEIKEFWQDSQELPASARLVYVNIDLDKNYFLLKNIEAQLKVKRPGSSFPIVLLGSEMLAGIDNFFAKLSELKGKIPLLPDLAILQPLAELARRSDSLICEFRAKEPAATSATNQTAPSSEAIVPLLYFMQKGCENCSRQLRELRLLANKLPGLQLDCYDIGSQTGQIMLQRAKKVLQIPASSENLVPMVAWQSGYIAQRLAGADELQALLPTKPEALFWKKAISEQERQSLQRSQNQILQQATFTVIAAAGLIDGINPCAFATSIFLIGYLLYLKRRPRQILLIGACFCLGVFVSYLFFGLGFSFLIDFLSQYAWIKALIYLLFGMAALILAVFHGRDTYRFRKSGKTSDMNMGLSNKTHRKIHEQIKKMTSVRSWLLIPAALLLGSVVSSMELACTGQIYLPTLVAINSSGVNLQAFSLLLLYNLFFIVPLLIVTLLAAYGVGGQALVSWARRHILLTKILMTLLFACLAILMFIFSWQERPNHKVEFSTEINCLQR